MEVPGVRNFRTDDARLTPFRRDIENWLLEARSRAVLVRADRYIFGTGEPPLLLNSYAEQAGSKRSPMFQIAS